MDKKKINEIRKIVTGLAESGDWKFHISPVVEYSKRLAKELKVNEEIIKLAALLYDIGRIKFGGENHHITGAKEVKNIDLKRKLLKK